MLESIQTGAELSGGWNLYSGKVKMRQINYKYLSNIQFLEEFLMNTRKTFFFVALCFVANNTQAAIEPKEAEVFNDIKSLFFYESGRSNTYKDLQLSGSDASSLLLTFYEYADFNYSNCVLTIQQRGTQLIPKNRDLGFKGSIDKNYNPKSFMINLKDVKALELSVSNRFVGPYSSESGPQGVFRLRFLIVGNSDSTDLLANLKENFIYDDIAVKTNDFMDSEGFKALKYAIKNCGGNSNPPEEIKQPLKKSKY